MPQRTITPATAWPLSPIPKSSAAKLTVCVNSVLTNAADIDAAASRPSTLTWIGVSRSGGAHGGSDPSPRDRVGAGATRIGHAKIQPNHGITSRYAVVSTDVVAVGTDLRASTR